MHMTLKHCCILLVVTWEAVRLIKQATKNLNQISSSKPKPLPNPAPVPVRYEAYYPSESTRRELNRMVHVLQTAGIFKYYLNQWWPNSLTWSVIFYNLVWISWNVFEIFNSCRTFGSLSLTSNFATFVVHADGLTPIDVSPAAGRGTTLFGSCFHTNASILAVQLVSMFPIT